MQNNTDTHAYTHMKNIRKQYGTHTNTTTKHIRNKYGNIQTTYGTNTEQLHTLVKYMQKSPNNTDKYTHTNTNTGTIWTTMWTNTKQIRKTYGKHTKN
jgi:hypothetical protein